MASKYLQKFPVPEGFPEVLHGKGRNILFLSFSEFRGEIE